MKICKKCGKEKPRSEFYFDNTTKDGLSSYCKSCNSIGAWERTLHHKYNLTVKQYELMLKSQNGVCAICGQPETREDQNGRIKRLGVDHDHSTGDIRGLLCNKCNRMLGEFGDNSELLKKAALYLKDNYAPKTSQTEGR